jgi:phage repressor protein C with HTH and peptisase S24 domain
MQTEYGIYAAPSTAYLPHDFTPKARHNRRMAAIDILIERIAAKIAERNLTEREASIDATGKPDALRYIRKRRAMPNAERLEKIAETLGTTADWLLGKNGAADRVDGQKAPFAPEQLRRLPRTLPIVGSALGADLEFCTSGGGYVAVEQTELNTSAPRDFMARPTSLAGHEEWYVIIVSGISMQPRFDDGRRLLVDGKRPPVMGDDVVVQLKTAIGDEGEAEVTAVLVKQLVRRKAGVVVLKQFTPEVEFEVPNDRIHAIHRITPWDEALGV